MFRPRVRLRREVVDVPSDLPSLGRDSTALDRTALDSTTLDSVALDGARLDQVFAGIRAELDVPAAFSAEVLADAERSARQPDLPDTDLTDLAFFTIDPAGSTDLDQAMQLERDGTGYRVRYAIADVPAFVSAGSPVDVEARHRGQTLYAPDARVSMHPPALSERAASLLPGQVRPAYVWELQLDGDGEVRAADVRRAMVRSREQLDYASVQAEVDAGRAEDRIALLREVGERRLQLERARGGASLPMPEQEIVASSGGYRLRHRPPRAAEDWNAQVSLMTGMAAADLMLAGGVGILRTLPIPDRVVVARFHRQARALGASWPAEMLYGEFIRSLDVTDPRHLALIHESTALFRGAGYTPFDGAVPERVQHAAVASAYAHVTAPLRRLVDRFALVVCHALCQGDDVPEWVREALPQLPAAMSRSDQLAGDLERACLDAVEAALLAGREGEEFTAVVVDVREAGGGLVQLSDPAVLARCEGMLTLGQQVGVRLVEADVRARTVAFAVA